MPMTLTGIGKKCLMHRGASGCAVMCCICDTMRGLWAAFILLQVLIYDKKKPYIA